VTGRPGRDVQRGDGVSLGHAGLNVRLAPIPLVAEAAKVDRDGSAFRRLNANAILNKKRFDYLTN